MLYLIFYAMFESSPTLKPRGFCPCADSHEPSLLETIIRLPKIVIFLFFSARFYFNAHFYPVLKQ